MGTARHRIRRWRELPRRQQALILRAWLVVAVVRAALWFCRLSTARRMAEAAAGPRGRYRVGELVWAVTAVSSAVPRATCLTQAVALHALLGGSSHRSRVEIGVAKHPKFDAHAWVQCDGHTVLGHHPRGRYTAVWAWE